MDQQRAHQESVSGPDRARSRTQNPMAIQNLRAAQPPKSVSPRNHPEWPIRSAACIQVDPNTEHLFEDPNRGLHVQHTCLPGPGPEPGYLHSCSDRDGQILMPGDLPVCRARLVEENSPDRQCVLTEGRLDDGHDPGRFGQGGDLRHDVEQIADGVRAAPAPHRIRGHGAFQGSDGFPAFIRREDSMPNDESISGQVVYPIPICFRRPRAALPHRMTLSSPTRRVTRSRSRCSSSGIAYFRVMPVSSLNAGTLMRSPCCFLYPARSWRTFSSALR